MNGWVKLHRDWAYSPVINKDSEHIATFIYLLTRAIFEEGYGFFGGEKIKLNAGQLLCVKGQLCKELKIERHKLDRILKLYEREKLIEQQTDNHKTLITLVNWEYYQGKNEQQNGQPMINKGEAQEEKENEKEKRSKREKAKVKELYKKGKKGRNVCSADTQKRSILLGKYENVLVDKEFLDSFMKRYSYWETIVENLSIYKQAKGIENQDDRPFLERFAISDRDKYEKKDKSYTTFDPDEFFEAALKRSYESFDDEE